MEIDWASIERVTGLKKIELMLNSDQILKPIISQTYNLVHQLWIEIMIF